jgi:hypothetical protein
MILPLQLWLRGAFASDQPSPKVRAPSRQYERPAIYKFVTDIALRAIEKRRRGMIMLLV